VLVVRAPLDEATQRELYAMGVVSFETSAPVLSATHVLHAVKAEGVAGAEPPSPEELEDERAMMAPDDHTGALDDEPLCSACCGPMVLSRGKGGRVRADCPACQQKAGTSKWVVKSSRWLSNAELLAYAELLPPCSDDHDSNCTALPFGAG
jgi:hypothetical protein